MGGPGSSRWYGHCKAIAVEWCRHLDANKWARQGVFGAGTWHTGSWHWFRDASRTEEVAAIGYEVCTLDPAAGWLRLFYTFSHSGVSVDYRVGLQTTRPNFGGLRWSFTCPLAAGRRACHRRVGKLYLPPGGQYFGCRHCHGLTYARAQWHDRRVDALRRDPVALDALLNNLEAASFSQLTLVLKLIPYAYG